MRTIFTLLLTALLAIPSFAAPLGKITVDPNAAGAASKTTEYPDTDQKVTYEARRKCLSVIIADLAKMTGVDLRAGVNSNDWQVRDRKMNIFAVDVPLADLMASIARSMQFKWTKSEGDDKAPVYRLYMDRKILLSAEAMAARIDQQNAERQAKERMSLLEGFATADQLSSEELNKLKIENPLMYVMASSGMSAGLGGLLGESPALVEAISKGQQVSMGGADLSAAGQEGLNKFVSGYSNLISKLTQGKDQVPNMSSVNIADVGIDINSKLQSEQGLLFSLSLNINGEDINVDLPSPDSALGKLVGRVFTNALDSEKPIDQILRGLEPELESAIISHVQSIGYFAPEIEHPDDPALHASVQIEAQQKNLADNQAALAKASGFAVVSDAIVKRVPLSIPKDKMELINLLDRISKPCLYNWNKQTLIIEFSDRKWFQNRSAQIPEAWLEKWREAAKKNGTLDISQISQIASLTREQFSLNIMEDDLLATSELPSIVLKFQDMLQFYANLTPAQRKVMFSKSGLDISDLSDAQLLTIRTLITRRQRAFLKNPDAKVSVNASCTTAGRLKTYTFTISTTDDIKPIELKFTTPKYEEKSSQTDASNPSQKSGSDTKENLSR